MFMLRVQARTNPDITTSAECSAKRGQRVNVHGFVHRIRSLGGAVFLVWRDEAGTVQVFIDPNTEGFRGVKEGFIVKVSGLCKSEAMVPPRGHCP